ncbi:cation:proton antiporter [Thiohalomonas denitrificans]|uniref:Transporter, monovalent cation:proton antiporter-2 (CPA2) family n=1 Tax=Thiohalomonas denitrificans TaxID=415747 RepID=A0A1G5QF86_9GAMM|nr:monovalent cation:proton antiporter-2 (CPA2) family protein [Thiohalomonas denitrificans]SCZ60357.1 transporter, monovalent cation:proton antiporter-2 (CPA2) family [Thiohalomonas denitrificans]
MEYPVLTAAVVLLAASVAVLTLFERLGLPVLLGYLIVGISLGPSGIAWVPHTEDLHFLAEFGVVLLLFTIGLDFSITHLWTLKKQVFGLGGAQVVVTAALVAGAAWASGLPPANAFVVGGALALSSTAVVTRELSRRGELKQRHGRLSVAVLIFQDLAVVPFLILMPALNGDTTGDGAWDLLLTLLTGTVVVALMLAAGRWLIRPLFSRIVEIESRELFTLSALLFSLAAAWLTANAGLSLALGAFLAGALLSETEYKERLTAEIRPFRDVLLGLFFVVIGMMLDLQALWGQIHWVLGAVLLLILLKTATTTLLGRLLGVPRGTAMRTGILLSQAGEFGLVLATLGATEGVISTETEQLIMATIIISLALTPMLVRWAEPVSKRICLGRT